MLGACAASLVLAAAAIRENADYRTSVDRALRRYAQIAAGELGEEAGVGLREALRVTLWPAQRFGVVGADGFPPVQIFSQLAPEPDDCPCPLPLATRLYFRLDLSSGRLESYGDLLPPTAEHELADSLRAVAHRGGRGVSLRPFFDTAGTEYLALTVLPHRDGDPAAVYGAVVSAAAFGPPFRRALVQAEILPAAILSPDRLDSPFLVTVRDGRGESLFALGEGEPTAYSGTATLGQAFADLEVVVTLSREGAAALQGESGTPPWMLLSLLVGTVALFGGAFRALSGERALLAAQRRFVAAISHDLRTPLAQIRLCAETLRLGRTASGAEADLYLGYLDEEARRLSHIIENVLLLGRRADRRGAGGHAGCEVVDLGVLAREEAERFRHLSDVQHTRFDVVEEGRVFVRVQPARLRRVLANLFDNAVKYGPPDQSVVIRVGGCRHRARLSVEDRGPGIPSRDRKRVFDAFVRLDRNGAERVGGTGIGLAVVRDLVEDMGGDVRIEDRPGGGAIVVVELERATSTAGRAPLGGPA